MRLAAFAVRRLAAPRFALGGLRALSSAAAAGAPTDDVGAASSRITARDPQRKAMVDEMIRVDHAGEVGAVQIYAGQLWALAAAGDRRALATIQVRVGW